MNQQVSQALARIFRPASNGPARPQKAHGLDPTRPSPRSQMAQAPRYSRNRRPSLVILLAAIAIGMLSVAAVASIETFGKAGIPAATGLLLLGILIAGLLLFRSRESRYYQELIQESVRQGVISVNSARELLRCRGIEPKTHHTFATPVDAPFVDRERNGGSAGSVSDLPPVRRNGIVLVDESFCRSGNGGKR